jgi:FkbM family methyltransferase
VSALKNFDPIPNNKLPENEAGVGSRAGTMAETKHHKFLIRGIPVEASDFEESFAAEVVAEELHQDYYAIDSINFEANDVVVDIGGHVGLFAIYLGLRFPEILIHSFEPFPENYELFRHNLTLNPGVSNVRLHHFALSQDGRELEMVTNPTNSGGATCYSTTLTCRPSGLIPSLTLDQVFEFFGIKTCKLLKIDCEGSEHEILLSTRVLPRVEHLSGEVHMNRLLQDRGYSFERLREHCQTHVDKDKIVLRCITISQ